MGPLPKKPWDTNRRTAVRVSSTESEIAMINGR